MSQPSVRYWEFDYEPISVVPDSLASFWGVIKQEININLEGIESEEGERVL